jgi:membrane-bound lytic murein transglycosylase B
MNAATTEERRVDEAKQAIAWLERSRRIRRERIDNGREAWTQRDEFSDLMTRAQIAAAAVVAGDVWKAER